MASAKLCGLALLQLATCGEAQLVFMFPQQGGEIAKRDQPSHMTFSQVSSMGSDGQMHTETHKVFTETSSDGLQKRMTEVDCKDGDCSKSVSQFIHGMPNIFHSLAPSNIFNGMPRMGGMVEQMPEAKEQMQMGDGVHAGSSMPSMPTHMKWLLRRMHHKIMLHLHGPVNGQPMPAMPMRHMTVHFLAPRSAVQNVVHMQDPNLTAAVPEVVDGDVPVEVQVIAGVGFVSFLLIFIAMARSCIFGKAQARERPLQELGQPLAPEAEAELGLAPGVVVPTPQTVAQFVKPEPTPTQMYLLNLYARAGKPANEAELATVVLRDVYAAAVARAAAA